MRRILFFLVAFSLVAASSASAKDMAKRFALGFVTSEAPVGGRYWFSPKVGVDLDFGLTSDQEEVSTGTKETRTGYVIHVGIPIVVLPVGDRVNFLFNPAFIYRDPGTFGSGDSDKSYSVLGALEFEVFVTGDFSVSAAHGVIVNIDSPATGESTTDFRLFGNNVTNFGFHYYFGGGGD